MHTILLQADDSIQQPPPNKHLLKQQKSSVIKRSILLAIALLGLFTSQSGFAQAVAQIGTGTDIPANTLYGPVYRYSSTSTSSGARVNMLWTATEMANAGIPAGSIITGVEFNKTNAASFNGTVPFQMLAANTTNSALAATDTWANILTSHTQVINNPAYNVPAAAGWVNYTFSAPFTYTGGAFEVATEYSLSGLTSPHSTDAFKWEYTTGFADKIAGVATATGTTLNGTVTAYKHRPNIRILYTPGSACSGTPTAGTAAANVTSVCAGGSVTLSLTGATAAAGIGVQWQSSPDGTNFTNIPGSTTFSYATTQTGTTYYQAVVTCNGTNPATSNVVTVNTPALISGTFTINSAVATGGTNFQSFTDAVNYISCGIGGPVTFNVASGSGPYNEQVIIPAIGGMSAGNPVTFNGNGSTISANVTSSTANRSVIQLNGADYITINNLQIAAAGTTYGWGIHLINGADNNTISNNTITIASTSVTESNSVGIVLVNSSTSVTTTGGNNGNNNIISGNTITGGYKGIHLNNLVTSAGNNQITGNTINGFYSGGIEVNGANATLIESNDISRATRTDVGSFYGITLAGTAQNTVVSKNRIHNTHDVATTLTGLAYGIYSTSNDAPSGSENIVKNNLIYNFGGTGTQAGIYNSGSDGVFYYHNTISLDDQAATAGITRGFYQLTAATNIQFINNNISITRGGTGAKNALYFGTTTSAIVSNYNNLYVNSAAGTNGVGYFGANFATLADWQTANSGAYDLNSVSADPAYETGTLKPTSGAMNNKGTPLAAVTVDFTGAARTATPDPGAYEFTPAPLDMGAIALVSPAATSCFSAAENVTVTIQNFGGIPVDFSANPTTVYVNVTGAATQTFTSIINGGTLASGATMDVTVGTLNMTANGTYTFNATATVTGDANTANDAMTAETRTLAAPVALPQTADFAGFTGANLTTVFPNWYEASGTSRAVTTSTWTSSSSTQTTALGSTTAKINLFTSTKNEWIIGPKITPAATTALKFKAAVTDYANGNATTEMAGTDDKVQVMVSTDCGATFTAIETLDATDNLTNVLTDITVPLAAYAGQNIILAFYATDGPVDEGVDYDFHIDEIFIGTPPTLDMGATVLAAPGTTGCTSAAENIIVTVQNFGLDPIDFSANPATVTVNVTGAVTQTLTTVVNTGTLAAGATLNVTVGQLDMRTVGGTYTFNGSATVTGDGNTANDAMTQAIRTVAPLAILPESVDFTGFTGSNLVTVFPNWKEMVGVTPAGTTSAWTSSGAAQTTAFGSTTARINLYLATRNEWIIGPKITATAGTALKYKVAITDNGNADVNENNGMAGTDDKVQVMVSTDCGATFTAIYTHNAANTAAITNSLVDQTVSLAAYAGQDIIVAFYATDGPVDDLNDYDFHIDDIFIGTPPALDIAATVLTSPTTMGCFSASEPVQVTIYNNGTAPIDFSSNPVTVTVNVTGAVTQTISTIINTGTLAAGATQNVLAGTLNMTTAGTYTFNGSATVTGDGNTSNDAMLAATRTLAPVVTMPEAIDFTGFTGSNLATVFLNWKEANGTTPAGTTSAWTSSVAAQTTLFGSTTARIYMYGTSRDEWIIGPKIAPTATSSLKFNVAITETGTAAVDGTNGMAGTDDKVQVMVSTDCGTTFAPLYTFSAANTAGITNALATQEISLAAYAGQNIIVAFYATDGPIDDANTYDFHIDNISMGECTPGMWNGMVSSAWDNAANWSCNILPTALTDVMIPAGVKNFPEISVGTALAKNIVVATGATFTIIGGTLQLHGDLIDPAGFSHTGGLLELAGAGAQQLKGVSLASLAVNGTGTKIFGSDIAISNSVTMTSGILNTSGFKLMLGATATISETTASHVLGQVETTRMISSTTMADFGGIGLEITPSATSALPGSTTVRRVTGTAMPNVGNGSSIARYFTVQATNNTGLDLGMVFRYLEHEYGTMNESILTLYKSGVAGASWAQDANSTVDGTLNTLSLTGAADINQWWTAGEFVNPLPVELVSFTAKKQEANALLNWTTASEKDSKGFEIEVSTNGRDFRKIGFMESRNGNTMQHYTFTDKENGKAGISYYRLKQVDLNGDFAYSAVKAVSFDNHNQVVSVYPNPFNSEVNLSIAALAAETATVTITDLTGKTVSHKAVKVEAGLNQLKLQPANSLPAGAYLITIQVGVERFTTKLLKQ